MKERQLPLQPNFIDSRKQKCQVYNQQRLFFQSVFSVKKGEGKVGTVMSSVKRKVNLLGNDT